VISWSRTTQRHWPKQGGKRFVKVASGNTFEVEPGLKLPDGFGFQQVGRQDCRGEPDILGVAASDPHTGTLTGTAQIPVSTLRSGR